MIRDLRVMRLKMIIVTINKGVFKAVKRQILISMVIKRMKSSMIKIKTIKL